MSESETIILVMADAARRAQCFAALADRPQRVVRGFAVAADAVEAIDDAITGCVVIDRTGLTPNALVALLDRVRHFPALFPLVLADGLEAGEMLALVRAAPLEIAPATSTPAAIAAKVTALMPLAAARGRHWRDSRIAAELMAKLSPREATVLSALARGQTSKDIARALGVSPRTVEVHRASIMRRTGSPSLAALLRMSILVELADRNFHSKAA